MVFYFFGILALLPVPRVSVHPRQQVQIVLEGEVFFGDGEEDVHVGGVALGAANVEDVEAVGVLPRKPLLLLFTILLLQEAAEFVDVCVFFY